ncbi:hypothetical protein Elgi_38880 [Paenibacillus elgii]|uniref:hypothetical protein n=1 Tax=Paenibacillus elgii TaxID=189691 RepID=UPI002D7C3B0D|nr:hypothetical protein Elgi_38880 [Paenibacillus elgii]
MNSIELLTLHNYFKNNFKINKIPFCTIELINTSSVKVDGLLEYLEKHKMQTEDITKKFNEDESLLSFAIIKYTLKKINNQKPSA